MKLKKVNKIQAIKHWRNGEEVGLIPCKCYPNNPWMSLCWVEKTNYVESVKLSIELQQKYPKDDPYYAQFNGNCDIDLLAWEQMYNDYAYYNLGYNELGKYAHYYIEVK